MGNVMGSLTGKVAVVTGAGRGIGQEYALALAAQGVRVTVADIVDGGETVARIQAAGGEAFYRRADVTSEADVEQLATATAQRWGGIDILVNNAALYAGMGKHPWDSLTVADWERMLRVNVIGMWLVTRAVVPHMRARGGGKIVNIASGVVFSSPALMAHYNTSKAAVVGLTRSLARELGEERINVNALSPGVVNNESSRTVSSAEYLESKAVQQQVFKRSIQASDLVGTLLYLCSDLSDFMTGQNVVVNGGASFQ